MKYYTFMPQFHRPILNLFKVSTIREKPKVKFGERFALRMWMGRPYGSKMGTLGTAVCVEVSPISIQIGMAVPFVIAGFGVNAHLMERLAEQEGFLCADDMVDYFTKELRGKPFKGVITRWDPATFEPAVVP